MGSYRITKADIGSARVAVSKQSYTGREVRPDQSQITVKLGEKTFSPEDYRIVRYSNNVDKGKADGKEKDKLQKYKYRGGKPAPLKLELVEKIPKEFSWR